MCVQYQLPDIGQDLLLLFRVKDNTMLKQKSKSNVV